MELNIEPADILEHAAELYEEGLLVWCPDGLGNDNQACILQGLSRASKQLLGRENTLQMSVFMGAREALREHLGVSVGESVVTWNDGLDGVPKTQEIVVEALKGAAKDLRNK